METVVTQDISIRICNAIEELRSEEGSCIIIPCENCDFGEPHQAIECIGGWTHFNHLRFEGDNILECLEKAVAALRKVSITNRGK